MIFAQLQPDMNWPATLKFIVGMVGMLMIVWLVFSVAIAWNKLFGRRPPIGDEIAALEKKIHSQILETYSGAFKVADEAKAEAHLLRREMQAALDKQDIKISELWHTVRNEDQAIRREARDSNEKLSREMTDGFNSISRALGRIEGKQGN